MNDDELKAWDDYIRNWKAVEHKIVLKRTTGLSLWKPKKPFLTAADLVMLREMKVGLVPKY